jgi:hypothetical protein
MKYHLAVPFVILLALPACSGLNTISAATTGSISGVAPDAVNAAKKALTAAHELHRATADFLTIAATTNLCHSACASQAKVYLDQSEAALVAGDTAIKLGDAVGAEAKITTATTLISQVQALVGHK